MGYRRKILEARRRSRNRKRYLDKEIDYSTAHRQCLKKIAYHSERKVIEKINEIAEEGRRSLRYYQCPICDLFHISHKALEWQKFVS